MQKSQKHRRSIIFCNQRVSNFSYNIFKTTEYGGTAVYRVMVENKFSRVDERSVEKSHATGKCQHIYSIVYSKIT